jgi:choline dehydrogenase-like flavoprotein
LASRLANGAGLPNVLLLEAGGSNSSSSMRVLAYRFSTFITSLEANWNYTTAPQKSLACKEVAYARGKGLGGSSAINFACWTRGPKDDFDKWSSLVADDAFSWQNVLRIYKEIESFDIKAPDARYANPLAENHGTSGPVKIEFAKSWEKSLTDIIDACDEYGLGRNNDINSGNPIGIGICPNTAHKSVRWTAASAYLEPAPSNLTIKTGIFITKVIFEDQRAIGVQTLDGKQCESC